MKALVMPARAPKRITAEQFLMHADAMPARHELIDGRVTVLPSGTSAHHRIAQRVVGAFQRQLPGRPWRAASAAFVPVDRWSALLPDVVVTFDEQEGQERRIAPRPVIVVEVVLPETEAADRGAKWLHYREVEGLEHYVLIAADAHRVELFSRQGSHQWSYRNYDDGLHRMLELSALDICLLLAEIYEGVELASRRSA